MNFTRTTSTLGLVICLGLSATGCIQEDPQIEALQSRLERAEERLAAVDGNGGSGTSGSASEFERRISAQAAEIAELKARAQRLETENSQLQSKESDGGFAMLGHQGLLANLEKASKPLREKIRPLYEIERAVLKELSVPENPYSCVVRLELINLATQAREEVDVPATANLKGEWRFPPIDQIATQVRARGQGGTSLTSAANPSSQRSQGGAAAQRPVSSPDGGGPRSNSPSGPSTGANTRESPGPSPATSPRRSPGAVPPSVPVPGDLAGEIVLDW